MFKKEYIENARARDGDARNARPAKADDVLEAEPRLGYNNGASLLEGGDGPTDHSHYPSGEGLFRPEAGDALEALAHHPRVGSAEDLADELGDAEDRVAKALDVHGIQVTPAEETEDDLEGAIRVPNHGEVDTDHLRSPVHADARLMYELYVELGFSVTEIRQFLEAEMNAGRPSDLPRWSVTEREIREELAVCGFLEAEDSTESDAEPPRGSPKDVATVSTAHLRE